MTAYQRAELWLAKVPPAISGSGGHNTTYTAAVGLVHGFGLSEGDLTYTFHGLWVSYTYNRENIAVVFLTWRDIAQCRKFRIT